MKIRISSGFGRAISVMSRKKFVAFLAPFVLLLIIGDKLNYNQRSASVSVTAIPFNAIVPNLSTGWFHKPGPAESIFFGLIVLKVLALRMAGVFPYNLNELLLDGGYIDRYFLQAWKAAPGTENEIDSADKKLKRSERDLYFMNQSSNSNSNSISKKMSPASTTFSQFAKLLGVNSAMNPSYGMSKAKKTIAKHGFGSMKAFSKSKAPFLKEIDTIERLLLGLRRIDSHDCFIRHVCQINQNRLAGTASPFDEAALKIFTLKPAKSAPTGQNTSIWDVYHDALVPSVIDCGHKYQLCPLSSEEMDPVNLLGGLF